MVSLEASFGLASLGASASARSNRWVLGDPLHVNFLLSSSLFYVGGSFCASLALLRRYIGEEESCI